MILELSTRPPRGEVTSAFLAGFDCPEPLPPSYLTDESRVIGSAERLLLPRNEAEVSVVLREAQRNKTLVTVSAGRTGVVGGAVPSGGWILSLERMAHVYDLRFDDHSREFRLRIGPGLVLQNLRRAIQTALFPFLRPPEGDALRHLESFRRQSSRWVFAPDPTEKTAQLGGMAATNASGSRTFRHGAVRRHIRALTVALPNGEMLDLRRGDLVLRPGDTLQISGSDSSTTSLIIPTYSIPAGKHACGYFSAPLLDPIDLFIGSEGTLGVITELEIALTETPGKEAEIVVVLPNSKVACRFVDLLRRNLEPALAEIEAVEYLCDASLALLGEHHLHPRFAERGGVGVFVSVRILGDIVRALEFFEKLITDAGGDPRETLAALSPVEIERIAHYRHALPETVNTLVSQARAVHPQLTKLGTDMAVPDRYLEEVMELYSRRLSNTGLRHVIFGHIGDNHLHVNILPQNPAEYARGKELYQEFANWIAGTGGSVSAEHGIGKLKKYLMSIQYDVAAITEMRSLKSSLDPHWLLNRGNLFDFE
ncbi:MAG: FAD-binding oxidoreductase [Candidatus Ozemobacteraceae bacterium]